MFTFSSKDKRLFIYRMRLNCVGSAVPVQQCPNTKAVAMSILQKTRSARSDLHNKAALSTLEGFKKCVFLFPNWWMDAVFSETTSTIVSQYQVSWWIIHTSISHNPWWSLLKLQIWAIWFLRIECRRTCRFFQRATLGETDWLLPSHFVFLSSWRMFAVNK